MAEITRSGAAPSNDWLSAKWRPMMGWMYMAVCIFDFILFPIAWSVGQALLHLPMTEWEPLTLKGAGLFHMAMGAILGVAAWSRGKEKITAMEQGVDSLPPP
jgi:Holin of 3TMs, for gene-transfer release